MKVKFSARPPRKSFLLSSSSPPNPRPLSPPVISFPAISLSLQVRENTRARYGGEQGVRLSLLLSLRASVACVWTGGRGGGWRRREHEGRRYRSQIHRCRCCGWGWGRMIAQVGGYVLYGVAPPANAIRTIVAHGLKPSTANELVSPVKWAPIATLFAAAAW